MAKKIKKLMAVLLVLVLVLAQTMIPVSANPWGNPWGGGPWGEGGDWGEGGHWGDDDDDDDDHPWNPGGNSSQYEWYSVVVQDTTVASGQGAAGDIYFLGTH